MHIPYIFATFMARQESLFATDFKKCKKACLSTPIFKAHAPMVCYDLRIVQQNTDCVVQKDLFSCLTVLGRLILSQEPSRSREGIRQHS